jgi:hypothetical protein
MAIHRRVQKAARNALAHVRGAGRVLQTRKGRVLTLDLDVSALDERLSALAAYIADGNYYESAWQLFTFGQLKGFSDDEAVPLIAAWCRCHGFQMNFVTRRVVATDVVFLVIKTKIRVSVAGPCSSSSTSGSPRVWQLQARLHDRRPRRHAGLVDPFTNKPFVPVYTYKRVGGDVNDFQAIKLLKFA